MSSIDNPSSETPTAENPFAPPTVEPLVPDDERMQTWTGDLTKTGTGLTLVLFGILSVLVSGAVVIPVGVVLAGVTFLMNWGNTTGSMPLLGWVGGGVAILGLVGFLIGYLMMFVGPFRCLSAPAAARGRGLIIGSVVCQTLPVIAFFGSFLLQISWLDLPAPTRGGPFEIAIAGLGLASQILFVLFMRRIAAFIGRMDLVAHARNILIGAALMASCVAIQGIAHLVARNPGDALAGMGALAAFIVFVLYLGLLVRLRRAIKSGAHP